MIVGICFVFGALSGLQLANGASTNKNETYLPIVDPGPIQDANARYGNQSNVPDKCKGRNYCTVKPDDYPQELFNKMFKGKFKEPVFQPSFVMSEDRQADPEDLDNCETIVTYEPLYSVKTKKGVWRTVVQAPEENYEQMVRIETCSNPGSPCFSELTVPLGLRTLCKQKYSVWEFLVQDGDSATQKIKVELPVCCSCHYRNDAF